MVAVWNLGSQSASKQHTIDLMCFALLPVHQNSAGGAGQGNNGDGLHRPTGESKTKSIGVFSFYRSLTRQVEGVLCTVSCGPLPPSAGHLSATPAISSVVHEAIMPRAGKREQNNFFEEEFFADCSRVSLSTIGTTFRGL